jgi:DNA-binding NtrC family response regulator
VLGGGLASPLLRRLTERLSRLRVEVRLAPSRAAFHRALAEGPTAIIVLGGGGGHGANGTDAAAQDGLDWIAPPPAASLAEAAAAPEAARIFVDGAGSKARAVRALRLGFADYLEWPEEEEALCRAVERHVATLPAPALHRLADDTAATAPCPILHSGPAMAALIAHARRVAETDCGVLITGETGTGKEMFADLVHRASARAARPMVKLNCAALPEHLVEAELFGHERGAFTGATGGFPGRLVLAEGGTLLLDEVGDLALPAQAKVLRALEEREVTPLGGRRPRRVDLRVIAATHQPLEAMIAERRFRADLFYRLDVARIAIPPLRERAEDVPLLFRHFLRLSATAWRRPLPVVEPAVFAVLLEHDWPGNLRELRNAAEIALIACGATGWIEPDDLPAGLRRHAAAAAAGGERLRILTALTATRWNKTDAARRLQCSRMTLYRRMRRHGLPGEDGA